MLVFLACWASGMNRLCNSRRGVVLAHSVSVLAFFFLQQDMVAPGNPLSQQLREPIGFCEVEKACG